MPILRKLCLHRVDSYFTFFRSQFLDASYPFRIFTLKTSWKSQYNVFLYFPYITIRCNVWNCTFAMCQYVSLRITYMGLASLLLDSRSRMKSGMKIINGMIFLFPVISGSFASFYYFGYCLTWWCTCVPQALLQQRVRVSLTGFAHQLPASWRFSRLFVLQLRQRR